MSDPTDTTPAARRRRPDIPREAAMAALVAAAIDLARELPRPADVTVRAVAERAGLNVAHISRYFGSREALLLAARDHLGARISEQFTTGGGLSGFLGQMRNNPDLVLRSRIDAHLLLDGVDPTRFDRSGRMLEPVRQLLADQLGVGPRAAAAVTLKMHLLLLAATTFSEIAVSDGVDPLDVLALLMAENELLPEIEQRLGWADDAD